MIARRDKKCFLGATLLHTALVIVLLVGPGFLSSKPPALPLLDYIPDELVDAALNRGGTPGAAARPAPPPPPPEPPKAEVEPPAPTPPKAVKAPEPEPEPEAPKPLPKATFTVPETKKEPPKTQPKTESKPASAKSLPKVSTKLIVKNSDQLAKQREAERKQRQQDDLRRRKLLEQSQENIRKGISDSVKVEIQGPAGGGPSVGNWVQAVHGFYDRAWQEPSGAVDGRGTAKASIVIAKDGSIISARLISPSGNAVLDHSVRAVLDRVRKVPPFPAGAEDKPRTVTIDFELQASRLPG